MKISEISIKRPSVIIVLFSLLLLGGIASYFSLGYELIPKFDVNVITVQTVYPGAAPTEVETSVTKVIEDAVSSLENVKKIESKSMESVSVVMITLNTGADVNFLLTDAQRKINAVINDLPDDAETPSLSKFSLDDVAIMNLSVTSDLSEKELYDLLDQKIQPVFARINGVAKVDMVGGEEREIQVSVNPEKLAGYGMTVGQVQQILAASNMDFPTGNIKTQSTQTTIRLSGKFTSLDQMRNLPITTPTGTQIRLSDIAEVQDGIKDIEKISRIDQKNTILMQVYKQSDANAVEVSNLVKKTIETIQVDYKEQNVQATIASDSTDYTINAANHVMVDLALAVVLVVLIMLFFLHSLRDAGIASLAIPLSLIGTFIVMNLFGYTLNLMSLLGLSLVVGIVVDDAIVVIENIHRHMEMGKNKVRAAYDGAAEIGFTVTAITLVIVVVFLPLAMSQGLVSDILRQFCVTVVVATLLSLFVSFTLVPWLYSRFGKVSNISRHSFFGKILFGFEAGLSKLTNGISGILEWALKSRKNKIITLIITVILFLASTVGLVGGGFIGGDFFPASDKEEFYLQLELNKDASIEQTNLLTQKAEAYLAQKPEIEKMITTVGQASDGMMTASGTKYKSEIQIFLTDGHKKIEPTKVYAAKLKREMENVIIGAKIKTVNVSIMGAEQAPLNLTVIGSSQEDALEFARKAAELLGEIPGASEIKLTSEDGNPEVIVKLDRDKMNALGLNVATVGMTMQTAFAGNTDTKYRAGDTEYDINIRYDEIGRGTIDDVQNLKFINEKGQTITLEQFAVISYGSGPTLLERRDKSPSVSV
ncbi:MAG TPA: efflux RND transporter permease subunit, partial [Flavobacterium sp.]|nr:efflux RND transporter permease subunit [Flavobacterium sp.]